MDIYIENEYGIIHNAKVDFSLRASIKNSLSTQSVHVVQFDKSLPVIKVDLFNNNEPYVLPKNAVVKIRVGKPDRTFVYKEVLGTNEERTAVYFTVDEQMTVLAGILEPVLEIRLAMPSGDVIYGASSPIRITIDKNPVQEYDVESKTNYPLIYEILGEIDGFGQRLDRLEDQSVLSANTKIEIHPEDYKLNTLIISKDDKVINKVVEGESSDPETDEIDINNQGYEDKEVVEEIETGHGIIIEFNKSAAQTAPTYYVNGLSLRVYNGNTVVFSSAELVITKIIFNFTYGSTPPQCDVGEIEDNVWTGNAREVTFTFVSQRRMDAIEIEYSTPAYELEEFIDLNRINENSDRIDSLEDRLVSTKEYVDTNFVRKRGEVNSVYAVHANGMQGYLNYAENPDAYTIPRRDSTGNIKTQLTPNTDWDVASKKYVDNNKGTKLYRHTLSNSNGSLVIISNVAEAFDSSRDYKNDIISCNYLLYDGVTFYVMMVKELYADRIELTLLNSSTNQLYSFTLRDCQDVVAGI